MDLTRRPDRDLVRAISAGALAAAFGAGLPLHAQSPRPTGSDRVVRVWDFEERDEHFQDVPLGWFRAQDARAERDRPGFPAWNAAGFDDTVSYNGRLSLRLPTSGGSASLLLAGGAVAALPDADYLIAAQVRTQGLVHARAQVIARLLDAQLKPIAATERTSDPVLSDGRWSQVLVNLRGHTDAAWIQLELRLAQPDVLDTSEPGPLRVRPHDYSGAAWFDDLAIFQAPRVSLEAGVRGNIFEHPQAPTLSVSVHDLTGERLSTDLRIYDIDGREVARRTAAVSHTERQSTWRPDLPALGWYRATLHVLSGEELVSRAVTDFLWVGPGPDEAQRSPRIGLAVRSLSGPLLESLPDLANHSGSGSVYLPLWRGDETLATLPARLDAIEPMVERLLDANHDLTFVLERVPEELAREKRMTGTDPLELLAADGVEWRPYLDRVLSKFGERVRRWQLGADGGEGTLAPASLSTNLDRVRTVMRALVPRPSLALPWTTDQPVALGAAADSLSVSLPPAVSPESIPLYGAAWPPDQEVVLLLRPLPGDPYGLRASAADLVKRAAMGLYAGADRIVISEPWSARNGTAADPWPHLAAWRTFAAKTAGAVFVGELPVPEGAHALIGQRDAGGVIIAWSDSSSPQRASIEGWLGESEVRVYDLYGNTVQTFAPTEHSSIELGPSPVYIEGVDVPLALFRSAMHIEPGFLPARLEKQSVELVVSNPWPMPITGRLRIAEPEDWKITPRVNPLNVPAGGTVRIPVSLVFGAGEDAGPRNMVVEVQVASDRVYPLMRIPLDIEIGLDTVELVPSIRFEPGRDGTLTDVVVSVLITNLGNEPLSLQSFALAPGYQTLRAPVSNLEPGASVVRRFRLEGGVAKLSGKKVRVGLREQDGTGRLNRSLSVP